MSRPEKPITSANAVEVAKRLLAVPLAVGNNVLLCFEATINEVEEPDDNDPGGWLSVEIREDGSVTTFGAPYSATRPQLVVALVARAGELEQQRDAAVAVLRDADQAAADPSLRFRQLPHGAIRAALAALGAEESENQSPEFQTAFTNAEAHAVAGGLSGCISDALAAFGAKEAK
jgi:hypothetical protein